MKPRLSTKPGSGKPLGFYKSYQSYDSWDQGPVLFWANLTRLALMQQIKHIVQTRVSNISNRFMLATGSICFDPSKNYRDQVSFFWEPILNQADAKDSVQYFKGNLDLSGTAQLSPLCAWVLTCSWSCSCQDKQQQCYVCAWRGQRLGTPAAAGQLDAGAYLPTSQNSDLWGLQKGPAGLCANWNIQHRSCPKPLTVHTMPKKVK